MAALTLVVLQVQAVLVVAVLEASLAMEHRVRQTQALVVVEELVAVALMSAVTVALAL